MVKGGIMYRSCIAKAGVMYMSCGAKGGVMYRSRAAKGGVYSMYDQPSCLSMYRALLGGGLWNAGGHS